MPFGDMTGPAGLGPMTGRGAGYCAGFPYPGYMNPYLYGGRGYFGRGRPRTRASSVRGMGRGWRNSYRATGLPGWYRADIGLPAWGRYPYYPGYPSTPYQPVPYQPTPYQPTKDQEKEILAQEKEMLSQELEGLKEGMKAIEKRLGELKSSKKIKVEEK